MDYSALEVVMLAALTGDTDLLKHMQAGTDMHCFRLAKLKEPYADVLKKCKDDTHPQHHSYSKMRTDIKAPSFAAHASAWYSLVWNTLSSYWKLRCSPLALATAM